jgi:hypothetical protein
MTMKDFIELLKKANGEVIIHLSNSDITLQEWEYNCKTFGVYESEMKGCEIHFSIK